jgi:hypothetical protein
MTRPAQNSGTSTRSQLPRRGAPLRRERERKRDSPLAERRSAMAVYQVDRNLPGIELPALAAAQQAAIETSRRFRDEGKHVRYIRSTFVPSEGHVMCLFEATTPELVQEVNDAAGIPYTRVIEAMDLTP